MSGTETINEHATQIPGTATAVLKLEVVIIPVSDVDRAKGFYESLGWRLDADFAFDNGFRVVQFTPPGSECSIQFGTRITSAAPGSGIHQPTLVVNGIHDEMIPVSDSYRLAENLPNAVLLVYPDAGHGALFQYHESFTRHAAAFLTSESLSAPY